MFTFHGCNTLAICLFSLYFKHMDWGRHLTALRVLLKSSSTTFSLDDKQSALIPLGKMCTLSARRFNNENYFHVPEIITAEIILLFDMAYKQLLVAPPPPFYYLISLFYYHYIIGYWLSLFCLIWSSLHLFTLCLLLTENL